MRVTDRMRYQDFVPHYQSLLARQIQLQRQIATGSKLQDPSDDPAAAARSNLLQENVAALGFATALSPRSGPIFRPSEPQSMLPAFWYSPEWSTPTFT